MQGLGFRISFLDPFIAMNEYLIATQLSVLSVAVVRGFWELFQDESVALGVHLGSPLLDESRIRS